MSEISRKGTVMFVVVVFLSAVMLTSGITPVSADDRQDAYPLVEKARFALEDFMGDKNMEAFHDLVKKARGMLITPQLLKGAFIIGASGGTGVFVARDERTGQWTGPSFHTIGGASFGLQIGGQASEVILVAMTQRGVTTLLSNSIKLGADAGLAVGPVGAGVQASSANLSADILSFARSKGLYGGISLDGAVVDVREGLNEAYYGKKATPTDIFIRHAVSNPHSAGLIQAVEKATGHK